MESEGYGYSVWYVPINYKELQTKYEITHIPHVTLETNLMLRDAYHIFHNACKKIKITFKDNFVTFPSMYKHDPMISKGWYVNVNDITKRKLNWTPHMSVEYTPRYHDTLKPMAYSPKLPMTTQFIPPQGCLECFLVIADTHSGVPSDWNFTKKYFHFKSCHTYTIDCNLNSKDTRRYSQTIDEYFGTSLESIHLLHDELFNTLIQQGVSINHADIARIVSDVEKELQKDDLMQIG